MATPSLFPTFMKAADGGGGSVVPVHYLLGEAVALLGTANAGDVGSANSIAAASASGSNLSAVSDNIQTAESETATAEKVC